MEPKGDCTSHQLSKRSKPTIIANFSSNSVQDSILNIVTLPVELIIEIVSRLPVKSLLKFRCVSKSWLALFSSPEFIKTHLRLSASNKDCIHHHVLSLLPGIDVFKDCSLRSLFYESITEAIDLDQLTESDVLGKTWSFNASIQGSVHGLILLTTGFGDLFIWNPSIRKHRKLPDFQTPLIRGASYRYGFGYDQVHDDYKVMVIYTASGQGGVRIFSLKSDSWTSVDDFPSEYLKFSSKFVNGKLHWVARPPPGLVIGRKIISFDLADEKWGEVEQPCYGNGIFPLNLGVLGSDLIVLCRNNNEIIPDDLWIMKEYGVRESWKKMFTIELPWYPLFSLSNNGEILVSSGFSYRIYNPTGDLLRDLKVINFNHCHYEEIYIESLVCPFSKEGGKDAAKRKDQIKTIE